MRYDVEVINRGFYNIFLNGVPLKKDESAGYKDYTFDHIKIRLLDANRISFYKYVLSLNQRISQYEDEQIGIGNKSLGKVEIWEYLYNALNNSYGLCLSEMQRNSLNNPYDPFVIRLGLEAKDFDAIKILFGVSHIKIPSNTISLYKNSDLIKDLIDHYIALNILRHIDLKNYKKNEYTTLTRNRRIKKCSTTMIFNKVYTFNTKILSEPASTSTDNIFPSVISSSIDYYANSLLVHKKMLLSDASFEVLNGNKDIKLKKLIEESQKLYKNLMKKNVEGDYALNEEFLLEQLDEQTCCLPITLLYKWLSQPNTSFEVSYLLSQGCDEINESLFLFFMLLCNLPHYMAVSVLNQFNKLPTRGIFTNQSIWSEESLLDQKEVLENIDILNQVLLVFIFEIFPFVDRSIKSIILEANEKEIEEYKVASYSVLSSKSYRRYQEELQNLYHINHEELYYDNNIIKYLDGFLNKPLLIYIQQKDSLDIVKGKKELERVIYSQLKDRDSIYNMTHRCIKELFAFLYNEYRIYLHSENTYKSGHSVFIEEKVDQSNPQSLKWVTKDTRWNKGIAVESLTDSIYVWIKRMYSIDSLYEWGRQEDERLIELLKIQDNESTLIRGLTKYRYHYNDTFELSDPMKNVKKALTKFFKCFYAVLNCKDIEGKPLKKFVLQDEYLKAHINNSVSDTFDKRTFWLYLPYLNDGNINEFLDSVVTCGTYSLRKSYLGLYDMLEQFLWNISLYLEKSSIENQESFSRLKKAVIDKLICEPMQDRRLFNGRPNLRMQFNELLERDNN